jgi:lipase chaperone LimK
MQLILTIRVRQRFFQRKQLSAGIICRSARDFFSGNSYLQVLSVEVLAIYNKTIIEFGFCDILNYQGLGK